jgi:hypothetical protein
MSQYSNTFLHLPQFKTTNSVTRTFNLTVHVEIMKNEIIKKLLKLNIT